MEDTGVVFRLGKLFGKSYGNQYKLTEHLISSTSAILDTVLFNPTSLNQVLGAIKYELNNNNLLGVYNLGSKEVVSHYEYGMFIKNNLNKQLKIQVIPKHTRYFHNYGKFAMSCKKIEKHINIFDWKEELIKSYGGS